MSLINEALKRAKQIQVRQPSPAVPEAPLQPVLDTTSSAPLTTKLAPAAAVGLLILSFCFFVLWWRGSAEAKQTSEVPLPAPAAPDTEIAALRAAAEAPKRLPNRLPPELQASVSKPAPRRTPSALTPATPTLVASSHAAPAPVLAAPEPTVAPVPIATQDDPPKTAKVEVKEREAQLQGIFFRLSRPSALIDGQTVFVGDEVAGGKVTSIERHRVRITRAGKTVDLKLR